jgi:hypothetical protein
MDESCQNILQQKLDNAYQQPDGALWIIVASFNLCILSFCIVKLCKMHKQSACRVNRFSMNNYLRIVGISSFFFTIANYVRGIFVLQSDPKFEADDLTTLFFGNTPFAFWQLSYSIGVCFQIASKIQVVMRMLKFGLNEGDIADRRIKCLGMSLWSSLALFSATSVICAAALFFDSLRGGSRYLFIAMTTVIVALRFFYFMFLAILFTCAGALRYR